MSFRPAPFRHTLLALTIAFASHAALAHAEPYQLPAGPLAATLNQIASQAGVTLSIDPTLIEGKRSAPVSGDYEAIEALNQALRGTGLQLQGGSGGAYSLAPAAEATMALPDVTVSGRQFSEGDETAGYRSDNVKNIGALGYMRLQDAPYSVSVIPQALLQNIQAKSLDDVFKLAPATQFTSPTNAGYASAVSMRGFSDAGNLSIANDGLRFSNRYDGGNFIEEMERIEVLTGLSGFLYGPASPGGLVNYVLKRPTATRYNSVTLGNAGGDNYYLHGDFGGPIDAEGTFAYRLNVLTQDGETAIDLQKRRRQMVSLALDWNVNEDLLIQFDASHKKSETRGLTSYWYFSDQALRPDAKDLDNDKLYSQRWAFSDSEHDRLGSSFKWRLNDIFNLRGALAYSQYTSEYTYTGPTVDNAGEYTQPLYAFAPVETEETSAYLFLDAAFATGSILHQATLGYQGNIARVRDYEDHIPFPGPQYNDVVGTPSPFYENPQTGKPGYSIGNGDQRLSSRTQSDNLLIGDVITLNEQWSTILGLTRSRIRTYSNDFVWAEAFGYPETASRYNASETSPNVSLIYKPLPWLTTYASYIEGLQSGGIAPSTALNAGQALAPLVSEQYEVGVKAELGETLLTLALFNIDKPNAYTNGASYYVQDGRQENNGLELSITGKVLPELTLVGGITLLDPKVKKTANVANEGNKPTDVASQLAKLYSEYDLVAVPGLALTGGVYYTGKQYSDEANQHSLPSFTTFDAGARYRMPLNDDNTLTLRTNVSNLTNKEYWLSSHYLGAPRTLTFSAQLEF
ncbi:TonB-dependent receptor [Ectopseudomonas alcaliphila]|uniref:TonB-dependent receptor n=1 Tax=Ectopseudomonas alcaliphila TaxID=101564 RepID=UPI0027876C20|nr:MULTISPECIES: TonB-dependent receptor [Pseudomonas]MDP9940188.1 iron complex outermembrane receptor protein [Pseudomonas sp. 3400]MDR7012246.1 iron complex outermembrane receptor protein [Pseudomonas alcaliphila]